MIHKTPQIRVAKLRTTPHNLSRIISSTLGPLVSITVLDDHRFSIRNHDGSPEDHAYHLIKTRSNALLHSEAIKRMVPVRPCSIPATRTDDGSWVFDIRESI